MKHAYVKTCTQLFIAALFVITKNWKQCKCPSIAVVYPHNGVLLSNETELAVNTCNSLDESQRHDEK